MVIVIGTIDIKLSVTLTSSWTWTAGQTGMEVAVVVWDCISITTTPLSIVIVVDSGHGSVDRPMGLEEFEGFVPNES